MTIEEVLKKKKEQLLKDAQEVAKDVAKAGEDSYRAHLRSNVYSRPSQYDRTYALLNSIDSQLFMAGNTITIRIYPNQYLMSLQSLHPSWVDGSNQNENIAAWMNEGHGGVVSTAPTYFVQQTQADMDSRADKMFKDGLRRKGW